MVTDAELLTECKKGLGIPISNINFDGALMQKLLAVKAYMRNAGVSDTMMACDLAVGIIVAGVTDLWNIQGGETKFSPVFHTLLSQLAITSQAAEEE